MLARAVSNEMAGQATGTIGFLDNVGLLILRCAAARWNDKAEYTNRDDQPQRHVAQEYEAGPDRMTQTLCRRNLHQTLAEPSHPAHVGQAVADGHRNVTETLRRRLTKDHRGPIGI